MKNLKKVLSIIISLIIIFNMGADILAKTRDNKNIKEGQMMMTDMSLKILQASDIKENTLISPLSIINALGLAANGASSNTLAQMEKLFGMKISDLNDYMYNYNNKSDKKCKLHLANLACIRKDYNVKENFLNDVSKFYKAEVKKMNFDKKSIKYINDWVNKNTNKMIPKILDDISKSAAMYLINALSFEATWHDIYDKDSIFDGDFNTYDKKIKKVRMMSSKEYKYLKDKNVKGFIKPYEGKYSFAVLLPTKKMDIFDYLKTLNVKKLEKILNNPVDAEVVATMPAFESKYNVTLNDIFKKLGMKDAFDSKKADFSKINDNKDIFINEILHKTFIKVDERGTKAGAVTSIKMEMTSLPTKIYSVNLNRPFIYMIIDENNTPIFMGVMLEA